MTIKNSIIEFERLYHKMRNYDMGLPDGVLAYKFLNNANISEHHKQLVRATLNELKYNTLNKKLKKCLVIHRILLGNTKHGCFGLRMCKNSLQ